MCLTFGMEGCKGGLLLLLYDWGDSDCWMKGSVVTKSGVGKCINRYNCKIMVKDNCLNAWSRVWQDSLRFV